MYIDREKYDYKTTGVDRRKKEREREVCIGADIWVTSTGHRPVDTIAKHIIVYKN